MKQFRLFSFFLCLVITNLSAQDKILKLNGRTTDIKSYSLKGDWLFYVRYNDLKRIQRKMDRYEVFSIQKADGSEEIVYDPDTINEADPNVEQVRRFISGQQYGMDLYHPGWTKIGGTVAGVGSGFIGFYGPPGIFAYVLVAGKINTRKIPESAEIDPVVFNSEEFRLGYKKYTRNKIIRDGLIWGGIGFAVAFPAFYFIYHNK